MGGDAVEQHAVPNSVCWKNVYGGRMSQSKTAAIHERSTRFRRSVSFALVVSAVVLLGTEEAPLSLAEWAGGADLIATVEITARKPVEYGAPGNRKICGFVYEATTTEVIKGREGKYDFYSSHDDAGDKASGDYLVLLFRKGQDPELQRKLDATLANVDRETREWMECERQASEYHTQEEPLTMIPFDSALARELGEPWLRRVPSNLLWRREFQHSDFVIDGAMRSAVSWDNARSAIRSALLRAP